MPIHKVGYREWEGTKVPTWQRWRIISSTGIRLALRSRWIRRIMFVCWLPVMYWAVFVFFLEQYMSRPELWEDVSNVVQVQREMQQLRSQGFEVLDELEFDDLDLENLSEDEVRQRLRERLPEIRESINEMKRENALRRQQRMRRDAHGDSESDDDPDSEDSATDGQIGSPQTAGQDFDADQKKNLANNLEQWEMLPNVEELAEAIANPDKNTRNVVWSWLLMTLFRYPQGILILFLLGFVTPGLISRDVRSRAFLIYFSRPIGRFEYIFGKLLVPAGFIAFVTCMPALALYCFGLVLSPDFFAAVVSTWDIPIRVIVATFSLVLPTASVALMLSSLTQESRFATFAWFAIWVLGLGAWLTIVLTHGLTGANTPVPNVINMDVDEATQVLDDNGFNTTRRSDYRRLKNLQGNVVDMSPEPGSFVQMGSRIEVTFERASNSTNIESDDSSDEFDEDDFDDSGNVTIRFRENDDNPFSKRNFDSKSVRRWTLVSLYTNLTRVQSWIFGFESITNIWPNLAMLFAVTFGSLFILLRRVSAPMRV